ncbi:response regulator [Planctomicrobium sp. SH661]|uniref:response regulator n=1 Tax=Planctomicrobium sp. SH661 TaxID=3448124 RepID=UPI003F5C5C6E
MASSPSILLVDDESDICQNLADIFEDLGFDVETALCGESAMEMIHRRCYDVALVDLKMPGMDGLALSRAIRQAHPSTVLLIVTAYSNSETGDEALHSGVWQVMSKPVDLSRLLSLVNDAVRQPVLMVVDDDVELCESLWSLLRAQGYRVCTAFSDEEAIRRLEESEFRIILVGLSRCSSDNHPVLEIIRRENPQTKAIIATELSTGGEAPAELSTAADAVCQKPYDLDQLLETIQRLLDEQSL